MTQAQIPPRAADTTTSGPATGQQSNVLSIVSFVLSAVAVFVLPILLGPAAIVCGGVAVARKERLGVIALVVSVLATALGFLLGYLVWANR